MKVKDLIAQNYLLQQELNPKNKKFYTDLLLYVRLRGLLHDEYVVESNLLTILQDILDAQNHNISAEEYFGKNVKTLADELLAAIPIKLLELLKLTFTALATYFLVSFLPALVNPITPIDLGSILLAGGYFSLVILLGLIFFGHTIYQHKYRIHNRILKYTILCLSLSLILAPGILIILFIKTPLKLCLTGWLGIAVILIFSGIGAYFFWKNAEKELTIPIFVFLAGIALLGIATRLPFLGTFLLNTRSGQYLSIGLLLAFLIIFWILNFMLNRKK